MSDFLTQIVDALRGEAERLGLTSPADSSPLPDITPGEMVVLRNLGVYGPAFPSDLVDKAPEDLRRSSIYALLERLERKGFAKSAEDGAVDGGLKRRKYEITGLGAGVLRADEAAALLRTVALGSAS